MCVLCIEIGKGKITRREAIMAAREMILTSPDQTEEQEEKIKHIEEVQAKLIFDDMRIEVDKLFRQG